MRNAGAGWLLVGAVILTGCGDDDVSDDETTPVETGPIECEELTLPETAYPEVTQIVSELPVGAGGTLKDGDYELVGHVRYRTAPTNDDDSSDMRAALRLERRGTVLHYLFDEGSSSEFSEPRGFTASVTANSGVLVLEMVCPPGRSTALGYTASGDSLSIIEEDEEMRFRRK